MIAAAILFAYCSGVLSLGADLAFSEGHELRWPLAIVALLLSAGAVVMAS